MNQMRGIAIKDKKPIICEYDEANRQYNYFNEDGYGTMTGETHKEIKTLKTPYIQVPRSKMDIKQDPTAGPKDNKWIPIPLNELYDEFVKDADGLKKITNGLINMYRTGRDVQTAMHLAFHFLNNKKMVAEPITMEEEEWMDEASMGAIIFHEPYKGPACKLDINSSYPSIYSDVKFLIPYKKGIFRNVKKSELPSYYTIGIWRALVEYPDDNKKWPKLFKINETNKYTHYELNYAQEIGLIVELIEDDDPNHLYYPRDGCYTGSQCFKEYTTLLYKIKKENPELSKRCKSLLNLLWGGLCQPNSFKLRVDSNFEVKEDSIVKCFRPIDDEFYEATLIKKNKPYSTNWARMKPFLMAKGRITLARLMYPHIDNIYRAHTDSFLIGCDVDNIPKEYKISKELGELKIEESWKLCRIDGLNKIISLKLVKKMVVKTK